MHWGSERTALDNLLAEHQTWIEKSLGCLKDNWIIHERKNDTVSNIVSFALLNKITNRNTYVSSKKEEIVSADISDIEFHPDSKIIYGIRGKYVGREVENVSLDWADSSSVIRFKIPTAGIQAVFVRVGFSPGPAATCDASIACVITSKQDSPKLLEYLKTVLNSGVGSRDYTIWTYDADNTGQTNTNSTSGISQSWENLVLDESVLRLVQRDVESFFARKQWFLKNNIPFRRGYLLHGPPGNGKTSVIKAMLSTLGMNAYKIRLFSRKIGDDTLELMFRNAQESGPNMVILEDLDRAFPKTGEKNSAVGLHTLLNCLDGLESQEGVITIATANEPTALDKAILKRPGRFDRVILFDNPNYELRRNFFWKKAPYLVDEDLSSAIDSTEGFSFAQLQETYVMAGQHAYERGSEEVLISDLHACAAELRGATNSVVKDSLKLGYQK